TVHAMKFDLLRLRARRKSRAPAIAGLRRLHLGCGQRLVPGWVNADVTDSDADVDLASGQLPWPDSSFETVVSQHVIEHMELQGELIPLLREIGRVLEPGGEVWLSCPDLELF